MLLGDMFGRMPVWLFVFVRTAGFFAFSPLFSRRNIPSVVRAGLVFVMTFLIAPGTVLQQSISSSLEFMLLLLKELFAGFVCGMVFRIFYFMLFFTGDLMDTQFGISMAKVFDPGTNIQASVSGNFLNILFILYIFATDSHLILIRIFAESFRIIPIGSVIISPESSRFIFNIFVAAFTLAMKLAMPFVAAEFVLEVSMGILMKLIPQIHVFVINIQFKVLLGILLLFAFANPISGFMEKFIKLMLENMQRAFSVLT